MKVLSFLIVTVVPLLFAARIQLIDITPEEAQKLITQQSLDLRYSKKLSEGPAAGRTYNGKIIDSNDYTEEVYDANQFHGQDGLGRYIFGFADNQQARLEARNINGEVRGQYKYVDPFGNDIDVQYWSDSLGFHQVDNRPKYDLQPVTETPEVKAAREEHERLWKEAARLNGVDVDSNGFYHTNNENDDLEGQVSNHHQSLDKYPVLPYSKHISSDNAHDFGHVDGESVIVDVRNNNEQEIRTRFARQHDVEEVTSEPRGFFYSFDYPVYYINDRGAKSKLTNFEEQPSEVVETYSLINNQHFIRNDESKMTPHRVSEDIKDDLVPHEEVHDVQTNPKQVHRISEDIRDGIIPAEEVHDVQSNPRQKVTRSVSRGRGSIKFMDTVKLRKK